MDNIKGKVEIPSEVMEFLPGGASYMCEYDPVCKCEKCVVVLKRRPVMVCASGGGSRWPEIAGSIARIMSCPAEGDEYPPRVISIAGCSAGSINAIAYACGLFIGRPGKEFLSALSLELSSPLSRWPWVRSKQRRQRAWLFDVWLPRYWELCQVPWSDKGRIRDIVAWVCLLLAPSSKKTSPFSPPWSDPGTIMMVLKTIFCTGVNNNSVCFEKTASVFPKYLDMNSSESFLCPVSLLTTDVWNKMPLNIWNTREGVLVDQLGPHITPNGDIHEGVHPPIAAISYHDPEFTVLKGVAASCSIPGLMKPEKVTLKPENFAVHWNPEASAKYWDRPTQKQYETELYDGGLYLTVPYGLTEPQQFITGPSGITPHFIISPYLTQTVYSHKGNYKWKNAHFTGPWEDKPSWIKRNIVNRLASIFQTLYDCGNIDTIYDQYADIARGAKGRLTATEHQVAKQYLIEDVGLTVLKDLPNSRTMSEGWDHTVDGVSMIEADVILGWWSAAWDAEEYPPGWNASGRI
ncbi:MAG: hypothetical protein CME70_19350 [Halobacteriovorax sp.]|nr:hypothetical protein [Halobacteriovorax sp.]MBK26163.1 hypothetical protein [Halobacteriovorax sp.]|tara:strand:- start:5024 stop:6580 length:1557 start_codon:yes stop_codon:yes gene_type:complete